MKVSTGALVATGLFATYIAAEAGMVLQAEANFEEARSEHLSFMKDPLNDQGNFLLSMAENCSIWILDTERDDHTHEVHAKIAAVGMEFQIK